MYNLTLTREDRAAFDWVGHRYAAGDIAKLLMQCKQSPDCTDWDGPKTIEFKVPESVAWQIYELAKEEDFQWPCFSKELASKLDQFVFAIV